MIESSKRSVGAGSAVTQTVSLCGECGEPKGWLGTERHQCSCSGSGRGPTAWIGRGLLRIRSGLPRLRAVTRYSDDFCDQADPGETDSPWSA